ncbi:MAG: isochorismate synthase [Acidimicrobiia bacterium]
MTTAPAFPHLHAVTHEVTADGELANTDRFSDGLDGFDASDFAWLHHGVRLIARGTAARVEVSAIGEALASITADEVPALAGVGPIAVGALPFDPAGDATLTIPASIVADIDGRRFITRIGTDHSVHAAPATPTRFVVDAPRTLDQWRAMVDTALVAIDAGDVEKVVLAREVLIEADAPFDLTAIVRRLVTQQPGSFVYASEGFVGASPELLIRRTGAVVESRPMAGTVVVDGDDESLRTLAASVKDQHEHRVVVDAIASTLTSVCETTDPVGDPEIAVFGHVAHLATPLRGTLRSPAPSALELARALHPTPAVGGTPTAAALTLMRELEGFDRGRYAGPVGWVDARGDGEWAIALRGAELDGARARLVAGAGIVAGSVPDAEWAETQAKFEPMLRALVRP